MKSWKVLLCLVGIMVFALPALAQIPTGTVGGRVTDGAIALPGVTVTVTSPNLQGARTAVTGVAGDYIFRFLPPGEYKVRFELSGFQTVEASIKVSAAQNTQLDAEMPQARLAEEITVTGSYETIATSGTASTTFEASLVENLPMGRDLNSFVALSPGVTEQGPNSGITISGGFSYENLFMVNGVVLNENIRGQALPLFIEDAIEETTTSTSGISAEYGRFGGGVVNAVTKSGGNQFSGSFRTNFENPRWTSKTPLTVARADELSKIYEATLGGFALKDRLWFFLAGRSADQSQSLQTYLTNIPYVMNTEETRYEAKLTYSINPSHRLVGSYFERERAWENYGFVIDFYDLDSIYDRSIPEDLTAANYTGVLSDNFFIEAQYSTRHLTFKDSGSRFTDLEKGTVFWDYYTTGATYNSPIFCAVCPGSEEKRDNENILLKGSLFFAGAKAGSHDINFGYDSFNDKRLTNNWQSGSGYFLIPTETIIQGGNFYPVFDDWSELWYFPIFEFSKGTNFKTNSLFLNDRWRLNNNFSFNIGVRYDQNDGKDAMGQKTVDDAKVSPRVGMTWDPKGDGEWTVNASYATYVAAIANSIADSSSIGGTPAEFDYWYGGPPINVNGPEFTARQVATMVFNWFFNVYGGPNNLDNLVWLDIPGVATQIPNSLKSPATDEFSIGFAKRFGTKGLFRMDYVKREWKDFYSARADMSTGQVTNDFGQTFDLKVIENTSDALEKTYDGLMMQFQYRVTDTLQIGGNYTLSKAYGNVVGETAGSGPVTVAPFSYPEYKQDSWNLPKGRLSIDQKHRARFFLSWDALNTRSHRVNLSLLQNFFSGTPYGAAGIPVRAYVTNPGYATPPANQTYYYTARDAYTTDNITRTDLAANYSFMVPAFGSNLEFFIQPEVINVFNEKGVVAVNTTVTRLAAFNPFTTAPLECPQGGASFGQPTAPGSYQRPRTFRVSVGLRF